MSISVTQQPQEFMPVYNPQLFVALSSNIAQPNFKYTIKVTDVITGDNVTYQVDQRPDGYCVFDSGPFAENLMDNYIPINIYGWQRSTSIRKIRVNIGDTYGTSPVYHVGSNIDYIVWNGVLDFLDIPDYDWRDFVYEGARERFLTNRLDDITFQDRSNLWYVLTTGVGSYTTLTIECYDSNGNAQPASYIANPWQGSGTYTDKYLVIDIGHKGLTNISSGLVTGTYPILSANTAYYKVYSDTAPVKTIYIKCEPMYTVYTIHFLAKNGCFETIHFNKRSDLESKRETTSFKKLPYIFDSGTYTYPRSAAVEQVLSVVRTGRLKLNTDWLDDNHIALYEQLYDSPVCYLDLGSTLEYPQLKVITDTYKIEKRINQKLFQLNIEFEYTHSNHRQRG